MIGLHWLPVIMKPDGFIFSGILYKENHYWLRPKVQPFPSHLCEVLGSLKRLGSYLGPVSQLD